MTEKNLNNKPQEDATSESQNNKDWQSKYQKKDSNTNQQQEDSGSNDSQENTAEVDLKLEVASLNEKNLRLLAELDNLRRRAKEDLEKASKYAISNFVCELVATVENFFLANSHAPRQEIAKNDDLKNYAQAIDMTQKELIKILEKYNVKRVYPLKAKFDHNFHEAISQIESEEEEGTVVQVIQAGYQIGDRLLRPALVSVAKKKN